MSFENFGTSGFRGFGFRVSGFWFPRGSRVRFSLLLLTPKLPTSFPWAHNTAVTNYGRDFGFLALRFSGLRYPGVHDAMTPNLLSLLSLKFDTRFLVRDPTILDELDLTVQILSGFHDQKFTTQRLPLFIASIPEFRKFSFLALRAHSTTVALKNCYGSLVSDGFRTLELRDFGFSILGSSLCSDFQLLVTTIPEI
jgi:hypothetical protein